MVSASFPHLSQAPKKDTRTRYLVRFWLNAQNDHELLMLSDIDEMKEKRQFQPTIRNAIQLILDLQAGRIDTLLRLFPWIEDYFRAKLTPHVPQPASELTLILNELKRLQGNVSTSHAAPASELPTTSIFAEAEPENPTESRKSFAAGFGDLFGDDDDTWDD